MKRWYFYFKVKIAWWLAGHTKLCIVPLAIWANGYQDEPFSDWGRCDMCEGDTHTCCGKERPVSEGANCWVIHITF